MADQTVHVRMTQNDLGQILDGLAQRSNDYRGTEAWHRGGHSGMDDAILEVNNADEAKRIAEYYDGIIRKLKYQGEEQARRVTVTGSHGTLTVDGYGYVQSLTEDGTDEYRDIVRCLPPVDALHTGHTDILFCWLETASGEIVPPEVDHYLMLTGRHPDHPDQHKPTKTAREHELETALRALTDRADDCIDPDGDVRPLSDGQDAEDLKQAADHARAILED